VKSLDDAIQVLNVLTGEAAQVMGNYVDGVDGNTEQQSSFSEV